MSDEDVKQCFESALSDWNTVVTLEPPKGEDEFGYANFKVWRRDFSVPYYQYDGELRIGSEGFCEGPMCDRVIWQWIASQLSLWLSEKE